MVEWAPEVTVDEDFARRLIAGQFPEVALDSLRLIGEGWDNTVWLVDEQWVFRFPRRTIAIPGVEREIAALASLAPRLPLPIPAPVFVGRPADGFPWPFFGAHHVPGREPLGLSEPTRARLARPLGEFLRALHASDIPDLPADPFAAPTWRSACRRPASSSPRSRRKGCGIRHRRPSTCSTRPRTCRRPSRPWSATATCTSGICSSTTPAPWPA